MEKRLCLKVKQRGLNETKNWSRIFQQIWIDFPFVKITISKEHDVVKIFLKPFRPIEFLNILFRFLLET